MLRLQHACMSILINIFAGQPVDLDTTNQSSITKLYQVKNYEKKHCSRELENEQ